MVLAAAAQMPTPSSPAPSFDPNPPESVGEGIDVVLDTLDDMLTGFLENIPFLLVAGAILAIGIVVARFAVRGYTRGMKHAKTDEMVSVLGQRFLRIAIVSVSILVALSVAGIEVGAVLATLGLAGVAVALAAQSTIENFIAGVLILLRKPFSIGDQIQTNDHEGTVQNIDLRVTILMTYDNEQVLVPNADVLSNPIVNLTRKGNRRSHVSVGVDYRDDHNAVPALLEEAIQQVDGVLESPQVKVVCTALGDSAVEFDVLYWTQPHIGQVIRVKDRVLRATKDTLDEAGMTIPWPIRTLAVDRESQGVLGRD